MRRLLALAGLSLVAASAQCIVNNPGGNKLNPNRPSDAETPAASFSPISTLNDSLPNWICFNAGYRTRYEETGSSDYLLTRFRVGMRVAPLSWMKIYTEVQDADAFFKTPPLGPPYQETWDLRTAYVDLGQIDEGRFALRVGRQDLSFGDGQLIGTSYWRNASRGYDAVEAVTNWGRWSATAFAASQVQISDNGLSHHQPGNDLYGLDGKLNAVIRDAVVEPFVFWRVTSALKLNEKTAGVRVSGAIHSVWDYESEGSIQRGSQAADRIRAAAWLGIAGYTFHVRGLKTRLSAKAALASGDRHPGDGVRGTFDQLFPNVHDHLGMADQFGWQNLRMVRSGGRVWLRSNWIVAAIWNDYWLASATDGYYNSSGAIVARDVTGRSGTHIGEEYDFETSYRANREIEFGAGLGRVLPGEFLDKTHHPAAFSYPYVMMNYNFF
ncbi:MAG: alginate export family protein [Bryobacteraceae bacterium]